jgi:hypothetical protein
MVSMIVVRRCGYFLLVTIFLAFTSVPGCGDGKPSIDTSLNEATVTGVVSVQGVPATGGTIHFNPSNSGRIVPTKSAEIGPDGKYSIKTYTGDNQVTYGGDVATKNRGVGLRRDFATVQSGENHFDFDVLGAGSKDPTIDVTKNTKRKKR